MAPHLSAARRGVPRILPGALARTALSARLNERAPLTLLVAPAGHGKTAGVSRWLSEIAPPDADVFWVDLSHVRDADDLTARLADLCGPGHPGDEPSAALARHLAARSRPIVVCDHLPDDRVDLFRALVDLAAAHSHLQLVVCARTKPSGPHLGTRVAHLVVERDEMLFSADEVAALVREHRIDLEDREVRDLMSLTQGWPVWTHLALLESLPGSARPDIGRLVQAFGDEMVARHSPEQVRWLVEVRSLPVIDSATVARLGGPDGLEHLAAWCSTGELVAEESSAGEQYRVHPLAERALRGLAPARRERSSPSERAFARNLVEVAVERGNVLAAVREALLLDDVDLIIDLARTHWPRVLADAALTSQVLDRIPPHRYAEHPDLQAAGAWHELWNASTVPGAATVPATLPPDLARTPEGEVLAELFDMIGHRAAGQVGAADEAGRRLLAMVPRAKPQWSEAPANAAILPVAVLQALVSRQLTEDWVSALPLLVQVRDSPVLGGKAHLQREVDGALAHLLALSGDVRAAQRWHNRAIAHPAPAGWIERLMTLQRDVATMWASMERLDPRAAEQDIARLRQQRHSAELWPHVVEALVTYELFWGDPEAALEELRDTARRRRDHLPEGSYAHQVLIRLAVDLRLALGHTSAVPPLLAMLPAHHPWAVTRQARLDLATGDAEAVVVHRLEVGRRTARDRVELDLTQAAALARLGQRDEAVDRSRRIAAVLRRSGMRLPLAYTPVSDRAVLSDLCADLAQVAVPLRDRVPVLLTEPRPMVELTDRERSVLECLADGLTREETARRLFVSVNTIKSQTRSLYRKVDAADRGEMVARARVLGLL